MNKVKLTVTRGRSAVVARVVRPGLVRPVATIVAAAVPTAGSDVNLDTVVPAGSGGAGAATTSLSVSNLPIIDLKKGLLSLGLNLNLVREERDDVRERQS